MVFISSTSLAPSSFASLATSTFASLIYLSLLSTQLVLVYFPLLLSLSETSCSLLNWLDSVVFAETCIIDQDIKIKNNAQYTVAPRKSYLSASLSTQVHIFPSLDSFLLLFVSHGIYILYFFGSFVFCFFGYFNLCFFGLFILIVNSISVCVFFSYYYPYPEPPAHSRMDLILLFSLRHVLLTKILKLKTMLNIPLHRENPIYPRRCLHKYIFSLP